MIRRMSVFQAVVYGVVQGLTEFLPISSSAHLILVPVFTGWPDPGLAFNVALHWGTLIAVTAYFWRDVVALFRDAGLSAAGDRSPQRLLPWKIALATVPGAALGYLFEHHAETTFRSPWVIVATLSLLAMALFAAERRGAGAIAVDQVPWISAFLVGVFQGIAIVPGVSRSGITITAALFLGLEKTAAVRFSFLLSIPIILGAGILEAGYIRDNLGNAAMWAGLAGSAAAGWAAIHFLITFVRTRSFLPFVIYRLALAGFLAAWLLSRPGSLS